MTEVRSAVDLASKKPRILANMHFTGIEGSINFEYALQRNTLATYLRIFSKNEKSIF